MILPGMVFYLVFSYLPLYGIQIAFKEYAYDKGIWGSEWVGLTYFLDMFNLDEFWLAVRNTFVISLGRILIEFPIPILVAILLNELRGNRLRRVFQSVYTFPHFLSWIMAFGIIMTILSSDGAINRFSQALGGREIPFLTDPMLFLGVIFATDIWKEMGWSTIIYLAAIASINPEIYEAALVDGANRLQKIWYIVLPSILPTITILLILAIGNSMNAGFDQIFNLYNAAVYETADIIDTYVYRQSFQGSGGFSLSTAAGLFKSIINFALLLFADRVVRRMGQQGLF